MTTETSVFTLPDKDKYVVLPRNMKAELAEVFEKEQGKSLIPFLDGRTKWTPIIGTAFSKLVDLYYDYYQQQKATE
jgi:hypothetical protein